LRKSRRNAIAWTVIGVCCSVLSAQAMAGGGVEHDGTRTGTTGALTDSAGRRTAGPLPSGPAVEITSPAQRAPVVGRDGVVLNGTAANLGIDELRLFVFARDGRYYAMGTAAVPVQGDQWQFHTGRIGAGERDVGSIFVIVVAVADEACRGTLQNTQPDPSGNVVFPHIPSGCREADSVSVIKTAP
jgi:hypothetical protein